MASRFLRILLQPLSYNLGLLSFLFEVHIKIKQNIGFHINENQGIIDDVDGRLFITCAALKQFCF